MRRAHFTEYRDTGEPGLPVEHRKKSTAVRLALEDYKILSGGSDYGMTNEQLEDFGAYDPN